MKYLIRKTKDNKFVDMQTANEEYIYQYQEVEQLQSKENHYIQTYYDEKEQKIKQKYIEIPKTKEQILEEEIEKIKRAIADTQPNLSELGQLNEKDKQKDKQKENTPDLSELDNL